MKNPRRTILALLFLTAALTAVDKVLEGEVPRPRIALGALLAAIMLSIVSNFAPKVAVGLAAVSFITALTTVGPDTIRSLNPSTITGSRKVTTRNGETVEGVIRVTTSTGPDGRQGSRGGVTFNR